MGLEYGFWYDVAEYMNEVGRGKFTPREIAGNAFEYWSEWQITLENDELSYGMQALLEELGECELFITIKEECEYQGIEMKGKEIKK